MSAFVHLGEYDEKSRQNPGLDFLGKYYESMRTGEGDNLDMAKIDLADWYSKDVELHNADNGLFRGLEEVQPFLHGAGGSFKAVSQKLIESVAVNTAPGLWQIYVDNHTYFTLEDGPEGPIDTITAPRLLVYYLREDRSAKHGFLVYKMRTFWDKTTITSVL